MEKILYLAPQSPFPPVDGGKQGIFNLVKALSQDRKLFFSIPSPLKEEERLQLKNMGVTAISGEVNTSDKITTLISNIGNPIPFKMAKYFSPHFLQKIAEVVKREKIKIVIVSHPHMAQYALLLKKMFPSLKVVLREHNLEFKLVEEFAHYTSNPLFKLIGYWQFFKTRKYETSLWSQFDYTIFISDGDIREAAQYGKIEPRKHFVLYDALYPFPSTFKSGEVERERSFIFTGSLKTLQNRINLKMFIEKIWKPLQTLSKTPYRLYLTGTPSPQLERELNYTRSQLKKLNIYNLGFVEDLEKEILSHSFFLSPTWIGSGIRMKILKAMGLGMPVFLTPKDLESVSGFRDLENVILFQTPTEFMEKTELLLNNSYLYHHISQNARQFAAEKFSFATFFSQLNLFLNSISPPTP